MLIKRKPFVSSTAEITCLFRAKSFNETRKQFKTDDFVAVLICNSFNSFLALMFKSFSFSNDMFGSITPPGAYEYIVGRTRYVDNLFDALPARYQQVFILGAGFDSRSCRYQKKLGRCAVYECDHPDTQLKKMEIFKKIDIDFPENVHFIAMDFAQCDIVSLFEKHAISSGETCFFVLEGLICYLEEQHVKALFTAISKHTGPDSEIFFDYIYADALQNNNQNNELDECIEKVSGLGEKWKFGIPRDGLAHFLAEFDFSIIEEFTSRDMEKAFFNDDRRQPSTKVMNSQTLVRAKKTSRLG